VPLERLCRPPDFALPCAAYYFIGDVEEDFKSDASAIPDPNPAVAFPVAEMLQDVVGGLACFAP
jgi:hypothetical protein